ncbi:hypothetical protein [Defluviimonas sp. SAOS-178_SWC]|uniref:hypothetical protein n=1 Tax=Defluviimonas sp. SAOS-178_SWC TaxID=3121287 RepID=UPI003221A5A3
MTGWISFLRRRPGGSPAGIGPMRRPATVALLGADYPGLHPAFAVTEGEHVRCGQVLFTDAKRPSLAVVSPVDGTVASLERGPRRVLSSVILSCDPEPRAELPAAPIARPDGGSARATLLENGLWPAFLSRPFGRIPDPEATPEAIFVNAIDATQGAADPGAILALRPDDFERGLDILMELTEGPVFLCQAKGAEIARPGRDRLRTAFFDAGYPTGLVGHQIARLRPPGPGGAVWSICFQDVIAIGHLFNTGHYLGERVVSVRRADLEASEAFPTLLGAKLRDIVPSSEGDAKPVRLYSGAPMPGCDDVFLRRHHNHVTAMPLSPPPGQSRWLPRLGRSLPRSRPAPIIPLAALDRALPTDAPVVPLMRALSIGDVEAAERLGALDLIEEDVALLTRLCTSGSDYGHLLRRVLDELESAA